MLLALIWEEPASMLTKVLDRLGATRERIREELEALDVEMPKLPFRRRREWEEWRVVPKDELDRGWENRWQLAGSLLRQRSEIGDVIWHTETAHR